MRDYKYIEIANWAREAIRKEGLSPGDRFYPETELCEIHHVSRQTVRQALADLESEGVLLRRRGSGTFVQDPGAGALARPAQTLAVGVVSTYFSDYIFPSILTGIEKVLTKNGVAMQLMTTSNSVAEERRALMAMLSQSNIKGLIVEPSQSALPNPNAALYEEICAREMPLLFFNAKYPALPQPLIAMDDVLAARIAAEHLISLGHRKLLGMFVFNNMQGHKRYQGFSEALGNHGLDNPEDCVFWYSTQEQAAMFEAAAGRLLPLLRDSTAVVCYNDDLAVGLLAFCRQHGIRVPEDLSVCGIDDARIARVCETPLTSVRHPMQLLGETVAKIMLGKLEDPASGQEDVLFAPKLVKRASTAKVGKAAPAEPRQEPGAKPKPKPKPKQEVGKGIAL
ncbi:MAG: GntR family transcriptional regulator [Clostridiales Family XIII bacterium]|nr:GntR family transcriptional regulator [Clostridiales Family XIII bacterium]